jgi:hypothetical protein
VCCVTCRECIKATEKHGDLKNIFETLKLKSNCIGMLHNLMNRPWNFFMDKEVIGKINE